MVRGQNCGLRLSVLSDRGSDDCGRSRHSHRVVVRGGLDLLCSFFLSVLRVSVGDES